MCTRQAMPRPYANGEQKHDQRRPSQRLEVSGFMREWVIFRRLNEIDGQLENDPEIVASKEQYRQLWRDIKENLPEAKRHLLESLDDVIGVLGALRGEHIYLRGIQDGSDFAAGRVSLDQRGELQLCIRSSPGLAAHQETERRSTSE